MSKKKFICASICLPLIIQSLATGEMTFDLQNIHPALVDEPQNAKKLQSLQHVPGFPLGFHEKVTVHFQKFKTFFWKDPIIIYFSQTVRKQRKRPSDRKFRGKCSRGKMCWTMTSAFEVWPNEVLLRRFLSWVTSEQLQGLQGTSS